MARCGLCGIHGACCFPCGCWLRGSTLRFRTALARPGCRVRLFPSTRPEAFRLGPSLTNRLAGGRCRPVPVVSNRCRLQRF
ncbi:hypothetical protein DVDV_3267 [Desulfovibrio sp. DV]|nr:hypothetical protein DVDV_3267 [Desulfovibrio sp. DV]